MEVYRHPYAALRACSVIYWLLLTSKPWYCAMRNGTDEWTYQTVCLVWMTVEWPKPSM